VRGAASWGGDGRAGAGHRAALPRRLRDQPPLRPVAVGGDQGAEAGGVPAQEGGRLRVGRRGGRRGGRGRLRGGRGLQRARVRGRGRGLPGAQGDQGDVQEGGQAGAQGDEGERV